MYLSIVSRYLTLAGALMNCGSVHFAQSKIKQSMPTYPLPIDRKLDQGNPLSDDWKKIVNINNALHQPY